MFTKKYKKEVLFHYLDRLIDKQAFENKKIVLFGLNASSFATKKYLDEKGYDVFAYIDNDEDKVLQAQENVLEVFPRHIRKTDCNNNSNSIISAYKPEDLLLPFQDDYIILISSKYYPDMLHQLSEMGYEANVHVFKPIDFHEIDSVLVDEEDIKGLKVMDADSIRKKQLEIVSYVVDVCKRHNLNIYMGGGTLLGAVRHSGYIPWDDDVDLILPMNDYKMLTKIILEEDVYDIYNTYVDPDCSNFFSRIIDRNTIVKRWSYPTMTTSGVDIDVFPLSGVPKRMHEISKFYNRLHCLNRMYAATMPHNAEQTPEILARRSNLRKSIIEMTEQYDFYQSEIAAYLLSKYKEKDLMARSVFDETVYLKFENLELPAPAGYDVYLEYLYGDYMTLPSKKDQYAPHNYKAFYKN